MAKGYEYEASSGRAFLFRSEEEYDAARRWYRDTSTDEMHAWAKEHGVVTRDEAGALLADWVEIVLEKWASLNGEQVVREIRAAAERRAISFQSYETYHSAPQMRQPPWLQQKPDWIEKQR